MTDVIALAKQLAARENLVGKCQRLVGLIGDHQQGAGWSVPPYGRATDAYNACRNAGLILGGLEAIATFTPDMVGWVAYFEYRDANNNGHVGLIVGPDLMVSTTGNRAGFVADLGRGVFLSTISGYSTSRKLLGISRHNGTRDRIERLTSPYAPPAGPNVRTVRSDIGNARRRVAPDTGAALTPKDAEIKAGTACRITKAYLTGHPVAQAGVTTDVWYEIDAYGWAWAGSFTSQSLDGIPEVIDARPTQAPQPEPEPAPTPEPQPEPEPIPAPDPEPETPADPDPEEDPVAETPVIEVPVRVKLDDDKLAELLATKAEVEPSEPVIPDKVAKPLWVALSLISVSAGPVVALTLIDWVGWDAATGQQFATTAVAWAGSVAAVLGLSRFAKTK